MNKKVIKKSIRTFVQSFCGVFFSAIATGQYKLDDWKTWILSLVGSAVAAGLCAIWNYEQKEEEKCQ